MADPTEAQALSKISTEVDESQINVIISSQCIRAQAFLLDKLRKQSERHKEVCGFISSANLKLECEIKQAELEIRSLRNALETIKHANVELKKDYLLAKEKKTELAERINAGEEKYEQLWLESKSRYENIPFVKKLLQAQNKARTLEDDIAKYENQAKTLAKETEIKRNDFKTLDIKRIIELAAYLIHEMPNKFQIIQEKYDKTNGLTKELEEIENEMKAKEALPNISTEIIRNKTKTSQENNNGINEDNWTSLKEINDDALMMPKFDEPNIDLDFISDKLEKVKKVDMLNYTPAEEVTALKDNLQVTKYDWNVLNMEPYMSPYFITKINKTTKTRYSEKKLINILDDVNIGKHDAYNILSRVNPQKIQAVNVINPNLENSGTLKETAESPIESEIINVESLYCDNIVVPPTQFLDLSQEEIFTSSHPHHETAQITKASEDANFQQLKEVAKKVSFNLCTSMEISEEPEKLDNSLVDTNETMNNPLVSSAVTDEDFSKIKDMVLKKHNLDSSPQFVYAKNILQTNTTSTNIVTSKFFKDKNDMECENDIVDVANKEVGNGCSENKSAEEVSKDNITKMDTEVEDKENQNKIEEMEVDVVESKPKIVDSQKASVSGILFTHRSGAIPESLNTSISTTGYEDGEPDFPHFIDSNLLLSPKADLQMGDDNAEVKSQEVPNFLSGLRKTGLNLFGNLQSSTPKEDATSQSQNPGNSFLFNFGGDEKKSRGGFFNMFN